MALNAILQAALDSWGWEDAIEHDSNDGSDFVTTTITLDDQRFRITLVADEARQWLTIILRVPFTIPPSRQTDGVALVNQLNRGLGMGHFVLEHDGAVDCQHTVDVEDAEPSAALYRNMLSGLIGALSAPRVAALGAVAFTRVPLAQVLDDLAAAMEARRLASQAATGAPALSH